MLWDKWRPVGYCSGYISKTPVTFSSYLNRIWSAVILLPIFAAAIVGGLGSPLGAIAGGFVIAFSEVMVTYAWKKVVTYIVPESMAPDGLVQLMSTDYKFAVSFAILILVLIFMPTGLFKGKSV